MEMSTDRIFIVRKSWEKDYEDEIIFTSDDESKAYKKLVDEASFMTAHQEGYIKSIEDNRITFDVDNDEGGEIYLDMLTVCATWLKRT